MPPIRLVGRRSNEEEGKICLRFAAYRSRHLVRPFALPAAAAAYPEKPIRFLISSFLRRPARSPEPRHYSTGSTRTRRCRRDIDNHPARAARSASLWLHARPGRLTLLVTSAAYTSHRHYRGTALLCGSRISTLTMLTHSRFPGRAPSCREERQELIAWLANAPKKFFSAPPVSAAPAMTTELLNTWARSIWSRYRTMEAALFLSPSSRRSAGGFLAFLSSKPSGNRARCVRLRSPPSSDHPPCRIADHR